MLPPYTLIYNSIELSFASLNEDYDCKQFLIIKINDDYWVSQLNEAIITR